MQNIQNEEEVPILRKRFGVITNREVILKNGINQNKINFEAISRVNLIKYRVYYTNLLFLIISTSLMITIFAFKDLEIISKMGIAFFATASLLLSISHKFYFYFLTIKLNNKESFTIKSSQFHRDCIKEFYFSILKKVRKNKQVIFEEPNNFIYSA